MRQIKFRAWDGKMMEQWEHVKTWESFGHLVNSAFKEFTFMQFTGLQDKNGVEIYEGDVVDIIHPAWTNKAIVKFINGSFVFESISEVTQGHIVPGFTFMREKWKIKVIGNIHQNKNLLK